jgi:hypothetical protein
VRGWTSRGFTTTQAATQNPRRPLTWAGSLPVCETGSLSGSINRRCGGASACMIVHDMDCSGVRVNRYRDSHYCCFYFAKCSSSMINSD